MSNLTKEIADKLVDMYSTNERGFRDALQDPKNDPLEILQRGNLSLDTEEEKEEALKFLAQVRETGQMDAQILERWVKGYGK